MVKNEVMKTITKVIFVISSCSCSRHGGWWKENAGRSQSAEDKRLSLVRPGWMDEIRWTGSKPIERPVIWRTRYFTWWFMAPRELPSQRLTKYFSPFAIALHTLDCVLSVRWPTWGTYVTTLSDTSYRQCFPTTRPVPLGYTWKTPSPANSPTWGWLPPPTIGEGCST